MNKIIITALMSLMLFSANGYSQQTSQFIKNSILGINYNLSFETGSLAKFIPDMGYRGWDIELKAMVTDNIAVGGNIGWYAFYKKYPRQTYYFDQGALTSTIFNYLYSVPIRAVVTYYPIPTAFVQPFIGLQAGMYYNEKRTEIGFYAYETKTWNFGFAPEIGVIVPFGKYSQWGFNVKGKYNYQFYTKDNFENLSWFDLSFGLSFSY